VQQLRAAGSRFVDSGEEMGRGSQPERLPQPSVGRNRPATQSYATFEGQRANIEPVALNGYARCRRLKIL